MSNNFENVCLYLEADSQILSLSCQVSKSVSWLYFRYHYSFFCAQIYQSLMASHEPSFIHMYIFKLMFIFINPILFIFIFCELESEMTSLLALSRKYNLYFHLHLYLYQYSNLFSCICVGKYLNIRICSYNIFDVRF